MTDATFIPGQIHHPQSDAVAEVKPAPQPLGVPVFIHDCVTPLGGETLLSLLMKRLAQADQDE